MTAVGISWALTWPTRRRQENGSVLLVRLGLSHLLGEEEEQNLWQWLSKAGECPPELLGLCALPPLGKGQRLVLEEIMS